MFINSKISLCVTLSDGSVHKIPRGFIGEIPGELARHWIIQRAIQSGDIATPAGTSDRQLEAADTEAQELKIALNEPEEPEEKPKAKKKK